MSLKRIDDNPRISVIQRRLEEFMGPDGYPYRFRAVEGFSDVLPRTPAGGPTTLGEGDIYNTYECTQQLTFALAISPRSVVAEIIDDPALARATDVVAALRANQVLEGMKILDLGCGLMPGFALAATALGADVHTADGQRIDPTIAAKLASHTVTDFTRAGALYDIHRATGGDFDMVTENIGGSVEEAPHLQLPDRSVTQAIGEALLRPGGYYHTFSYSYQNIV